jgi:hypothetical protein
VASFLASAAAEPDKFGRRAKNLLCAEEAGPVSKIFAWLSKRSAWPRRDLAGEQKISPADKAFARRCRDFLHRAKDLFSRADESCVNERIVTTRGLFAPLSKIVARWTNLLSSRQI